MITIVEGMTPDLYINALNGNFEEPYETPSFTPVTKTMTAEEIRDIINANLGASVVNVGIKSASYNGTLNSKFNEIRDAVFNPVLIEEFDGVSVDPTKFNVLDDAAFIGYFTNMYGDQYYSATKLSIANSILRIACTNDPMGEHPYSSGGITTEGILEFTRGRIEVRAKIPKTKGMWPAIWLVEEARDYFVEIDMMERLGSEADRYHYSLHVASPGPDGMFPWGDARVDVLPSGNYSDDFHIWALDIYDSKLIYWVDGRKLYTFNKVDDPNYSGLPEVGAYLIINGVIGRTDSWGGAPDETTVFPQYFDIDYVRIYSRK